MSRNVYYKSNFKREESPARDGSYSFMEPFCLTYYTDGANSYVASYKDGKYTNCKLLDGGELLVIFEGHTLAPGRLMCRKEFSNVDLDYPDRTHDVAFTEATDYFLTVNNPDEGSGGITPANTNKDLLLGEHATLKISLDPYEGHRMGDYDFTIEIYTQPNRVLTFEKKDCTFIDPDTYSFIVDTSKLGLGTIVGIATARIPTDNGVRPAKCKIPSSIRIISPY